MLHLSKQGALWAGSALIVALLSVTLWGVLFMTQWGRAALVFPPAVLLLVMAVAHAASAVRRRRAMAALGYIAQAVRLNLPLPQALRAAEAGEDRRLGKRLGSIAELIEAGAPLGTALSLELPGLPRRCVRQIKAAERLGRLRATLHRLDEENRSPSSQDPAERLFLRVYPLTIAFVAALFAVAMHLYFNAPPPQFSWWGRRKPFIPALRDLMELDSALVVIAVGLGGAILIWSIVLVARTISPRRKRPATWRDALTWWTPVAGRLALWSGLGDLFHLVGQGLRAGATLEQSVREAEELQINAFLMRQVKQWREGMEAGHAPTAAAAQAGLPSLACGMIGAGAMGGNLADTMDFLSRYYSGRLSRAAMFLRAVLVPLVTLAMGLVVAMICLGIVAPMARFIDEAARLGRFL